MERQRGELVPIGDAVSGLDVPVKALAKTSPQARHHFTQADQVNQLVSASEADPGRGFMARLMALLSSHEPVALIPECCGFAVVLLSVPPLEFQPSQILGDRAGAHTTSTAL